MRLPPPLSVCNNFAAIPLPAPIDEMKPTWAELSVTALAQAACRYEVNDRERKKARSRSLVFKSESPAATCLPRPLQDSEYFVVFAKLTDDEAALKKRIDFWFAEKQRTHSAACTGLIWSNIAAYLSTKLFAF